MTRRALYFVLLALAGCGDGTGPAEPGLLTISLTTPHSDDGAVALTVTGPGLSGATPLGASFRVYWRLTAENEIRALVFGNIANGPLLTVAVGDRNRPDHYGVTITEVARRTDELREDLTGYATAMTSTE